MIRLIWDIHSAGKPCPIRMGCMTSKFSEDHEPLHGLVSRPDTPSIYSTHDRTIPSHSRNNSYEDGSAKPFLRSKFSGTIYGQRQNPSTSRFFYKDSNTSGRNYPEKIRSPCNHERQRDSPCFACLREKPKPRRHRSRRNAQVLIPRASYYGQKRRRSRSNSVEAPLNQQEMPPWVTSRNGVFVPVSMASELKASINQFKREGGHSFQSFRPARDQTGRTVVGGYIVSPEVYYSNLPLPELPPDAFSSTPGRSGNERARQPAWI